MVLKGIQPPGFTIDIAGFEDIKPWASVQRSLAKEGQRPLPRFVSFVLDSKRTVKDAIVVDARARRRNASIFLFKPYIA